MLPISVCIIAKNEEKNIEKLLKSLQPYSFEIVVVDTGSIDLTKAVTSKYTEHIYDFPWIDDFSAARNFSVSKASNDWILYLDCDHILEPFDPDELCSLLKNHEESLGDVLIKSMDTTYSGESNLFSFSCPMLFHRRHFHFVFPIHEQLLPLHPVSSYFSFPTGLSVIHSGYIGTEEEMRLKQERNIRLLEKHLQTCPEEYKSYVYFQLGRSYKKVDIERSLNHYEKALELGVSPTQSFFPILIIEYGYALHFHNETEKALKVIKEYGDTLYQYANFPFLLGFLSMNCGKYEDAIQYFQQALHTKKALSENAHNYTCYYNLATIYQLLGNWTEAIKYFELSGDYKDSAQRLRIIRDKSEQPIPISICMIGKNEEKYLEKCMQSLVPLNCELIFVDTGSSDSTVKIASRYTKHIYSFTWCNDFSKARNFSVSKASNDWILIVDCDEILENPEEIYSEFSSFLQKAKSHEDEVGIALQINQYRQNSTDSVSVAKVARFYSKKYCRFVGKIHEQVLSYSGKSVSRYLTPFRLFHMGYYGENSEYQKAQRNIPLLLEELEQNGPSPYLYYQLGKAYFSVKNYKKALSFFDLGLSMDVDPNLTYVQQMVETYGYTLLELGRLEDALGLEGVYDAFSVHADFVFLMGVIYMKNGMFQLAVEQFEKATTFSECDVIGVNSFLAFYNIGVIYECGGYTEQAITFYKKCGEYDLAKKRLKIIDKI